MPRPALSRPRSASFTKAASMSSAMICRDLPVAYFVYPKRDRYKLAGSQPETVPFRSPSLPFDHAQFRIRSSGFQNSQLPKPGAGNESRTRDLNLGKA